MGEFGPQVTIPGLEAAADLSGKQYHIVRYSAANLVNQGSLATDSALCGVLQNKPKSGDHATVAMLGKSSLVAGAAVTAGDIVTSNSSGRAATVASGQMAIGRALVAAGADGDTISAILFPPVRWSGAA